MDTVLRQWKKGLEVEVDIESVSFGGQGIARLEGLVVFVNGGYTGDRVRVRLTKIKKSFAEARVVEVLQPSGDRTIPPCSHFGICGGCKMQDLEYAAQLEIKRSNVEDVFERIGKFSGVKVPTPLASPRLFRYRNKMEFTFGDRPWLLADRAEPVSDFALGLHIPQRYDKVLNIDECHLATPVVNRVLHVVGEFARQSGLPAYSVKTHDGFWRFLVVREGVHTGQLMVNIITSRGDVLA